VGRSSCSTSGPSSTPWSSTWSRRQTLETIIAKLVDPVSDLVRTTDPRFTELALDPGSYSRPEAVVELLLAHPELMERPVVMKGDRA
jgi:arsenate reductase (glutaredoxin)